MRRSIFLLLMGSSLALAGSGDTTDALEAEARQLVQRFVGQLKPQLQSALAEGGPAHAITVCSQAAPRIADTLGMDSGWQVARVSLRQRNASRATPDAWEHEVLEAFDRQRAAGADPARLFRSEIVRGRYRYMQAQVTEGICLACHGETLSPQTREALQEYYPDDQATGYAVGAVRGAISLSTALPER